MFVNMKHTHSLLFSILLASLLLLAACSGQAAPEPAAAATSTNSEMAEEIPTDRMADESESANAVTATEADAEADMSPSTDETSDDVASGSQEEAAGSTRASWQQIELTDARSGNTFTLADFADNTVYVEPFATWCTNCRRQLGNVQSAYTELSDEAVFIALSVEPNIASQALVDYANKQGFEFTVAAMPAEMLRQLSEEYGQTIGNPPATPHFIIWPDGSTTDLVTGFEDASEIVAQIQSAGS